METTSLSWNTLLSAEKNKPYFKKILQFLEKERQQGKTIYPEKKNIFNALKLTPFESVRVVILGQDPYHGPRQAHGLSFSVLPGITPPPSLLNIYQELQNDLQIPKPKHGCLEKWAKQGVLLLNTSLTVEAGKPQSHANIGWTLFTDHVISSLNQHPESIVFLLWGAHAQKKSNLINRLKHFVFQSPHPSPLSAYRGFLGCKHFSMANEILVKKSRRTIDWSL